MSAFAAIETALADRDAATRQHGSAVGYLTNTVPVELIRAAGLFARHITGSPADETPDALQHMEPFFEGWILSVFQQWLDGRLDHLAAIVVPRSSEGTLQLYYHMLELERTAPRKARPTPILFDLLQTPFEATAWYNAGRMRRLADSLGALAARHIDDSDLHDAIVGANAVRIRLARLNDLRLAARPRLSGAEMLRITDASGIMAPGDFVLAADSVLQTSDNLPERQGLRLLLTGSGHDDGGFHRLIEEAGATITAGDHMRGDWWFLDPVGSGDPMAALLQKYHLNAPSPRSFPRDRGDRRLLAAAERAQPNGALFFTDEWDDTLGFDYPTQRDLLRKRGVEMLFLKEQSYRTPDRTAQRAAVVGFLESLRQTAGVA